MQFIDWIKHNGYTQGEVAKRLKLSASRVCRICDDREPTLEEVLDIEKLTHRKVKMEDFIERAKKK